MQKIFLLVGLLVLPIFAFAQAPPADVAPANPEPTRLSPGSVLPVELSKSVDAKKAHTGDPVLGKIPHDLSSNGRVIVPKDAKVMGHVAEAKPSGHDNKDSNAGNCVRQNCLKRWLRDSFDRGDPGSRSAGVSRRSFIRRPAAK